MQAIKETLKKIADFISYAYHNYLYAIILAILLLVVIIIVCIFLGLKLKRNKQRKQLNANAEKSVSSLTQEEIDNISNNVADRDSLIQMLTPTKDEKDEIATTKDVKTSKKGKKLTKTAEKESDNKTETKKQEPKKVEQVKPQEPVHVEPKVINSNPVKPVKRQTYLGKWKIKNDGEKYFAELTASNGGLLLRTELYTSLSGVKNGIETIKRNIESGNFAISVDKYGHYRFKLFSNANRLICVSEDYSSRTKCENGIESVKRFAQSASLMIEEND